MKKTINNSGKTVENCGKTVEKPKERGRRLSSMFNKDRPIVHWKNIDSNMFYVRFQLHIT